VILQAEIIVPTGLHAWIRSEIPTLQKKRRSW